MRKNNWVFEKKNYGLYIVAKANMVEHTHKTTNKKHDVASFSKSFNGDSGSNKRLKDTSFVYDKCGHHAKDFHHLKAKNM